MADKIGDDNIKRIDLSRLPLSGNINKDERPGLLKGLVNEIFHQTGKAYNVLIFDLNEDHEENLHRVVHYQTISLGGHTCFGVWVFQWGQFTTYGKHSERHICAIKGNYTVNPDGNSITFKYQPYQ